MATDCIFREKALKQTLKLPVLHVSRQDGSVDTMLWQEQVHNMLREIPAADVRPVVRGRWEKHEDFDSYGGGRFVEWVCSECDKRLRGDWATRNHIEETPAENFCPNCGADMREEK